MWLRVVVAFLATVALAVGALVLGIHLGVDPLKAALAYAITSPIAAWLALPRWHWAVRLVAAIVGAFLVGLVIAIGALVIFGHEWIPYED